MANEARVEWDMYALRREAENDPQVVARITSLTNEIVVRANAMSAGNRTGFYHRDHKSPAVGGTAPAYAGNVQMVGGGHIGIVYTDNYAARKDNNENNTLLKAKG